MITGKVSFIGASSNPSKKDEKVTYYNIDLLDTDASSRYNRVINASCSKEIYELAKVLEAGTLLDVTLEISKFGAIVLSIDEQ